MNAKETFGGAVFRLVEAAAVGLGIATVVVPKTDSSGSNGNGGEIATSFEDTPVPIGRDGKPLGRSSRTQTT